MDTYGLAQRPALANGDLVTLLNTESWRHMGGEVLVALLISVIFGDEVKVFATDDDGSVHLGRDNGACEDTPADRNLTGEGALLVYKGVNSCMFSLGTIAILETASCAST